MIRMLDSRTDEVDMVFEDMEHFYDHMVYEYDIDPDEIRQDYKRVLDYFGYRLDIRSGKIEKFLGE